MDVTGGLTRRRLLLALVAADAAAGTAHAAGGPRDEEPAAAIVAQLIGDAAPRTGRIKLGLPELAESGNHVPLNLRVDSPMTASDHVRAIHVVAERNPRPWVASFQLGPRSGRAELDVRLRLRDSQTVTAFAQMSDGSWWTQSARVVVTIGACDTNGPGY